MTQLPKVLVVEDEAMLREVYRLVLSKNNYDVAVAVDGAEALDKLADFKPDVVLLDLLMPRMDGITFLKTLPPRAKTRLKIIVYSNLYDGDTERLVQGLGADRMILKSSMAPDQLVALIGSYSA